MKSIIKFLIYESLATIGLPHRLHNILNKRQLTILMYHGIIDEALYLGDWCFLDVMSFRAQLCYLKKHFNIISLSDAIGSLNKGEVKYPTAVITFDDGYQNNFDIAYPILCEENVPATIFLTTGLIDTDKTVWTGHLHNAFSKTKMLEIHWRDKKLALSTKKEKQDALDFVKSRLKRERHSNLISEVKAVVSILGESEACKIDSDSPYRMLNIDSIIKMRNSNLISFGAHTISHPILSNLPEADQKIEIMQSIKEVADMIGGPCGFFAYPNGGLSDYDNKTVEILKHCGVKASLTTIDGTCDPNTPMMELKRFGVGANMSMANFKLMVHNVIARIKVLR